jgi:hypothetical protein
MEHQKLTKLKERWLAEAAKFSITSVVSTT